MKLFVATFREVPFWEQCKIVLKAWFCFRFQRDSRGYHWFLRTPLFMLDSKDNWWDPMYYNRVTGGLIGFWPNLPIRDGAFIYRWQKGWYECPPTA